MPTDLLSVVIPVRDARDELRPLHPRLLEGLAGRERPSEVVFVDAGSGDGSGEVLAELAAADARVKVVRLRRNYGQTAALRAGIDYSNGGVVVTMDGDLQNDPADVPALVAKLDEGFDAVLGLRQRRRDGWLVRTLPS